MQLITFASFKGGAGKTTALMATASGLLLDGAKIAIFEADENAPISQWRENARERGTWDENILILPAVTEKDLEQSFEKAAAEGCEFALVDTHGGGSELNNSALVNSAVVIIPSALTPMDLDTALDTFRYTAELFLNQNEDVPTAILITRKPTGKLTASESSAEIALQAVPQTSAVLHMRNAFAEMKVTGLLHLYHQQLAGQPVKKLLARHVDAALTEAKALATDVREAIMESA